MVATIEGRERRARLQAMLRDELESAWLYDRLADGCEEEPASVLRGLAAAERRHALHWAERLGDHSLLDAPVRVSVHTRLFVLFARIGGLGVVLTRLRAAELEEIRRYHRDPEAAALVDEEREHRQTLGRLAGLDEAGQSAQEEHGFATTGTATTFRAALFGLNDGLVSNLSLIAGVAGAAVESDAVLIAGIAGWLAGASSMGAGEYISVRSQRELFENQIARERMELELDPEDERRELIAVYEGKGVSTEVATAVADELMADPAKALDTHVREEFGLDPDDLGSPWRAAISSSIAFSFGAIVPVLPFIVGSGYAALGAAIAGAIVMLGLAGMLTSVLTGRHPLYAGGRMVLIGVLATGVTFGIGSAIPVDL